MKNSFYKDKNILYIVLSFAFLVFAGLSKDPKVLNYPPFTEFINTNTLIVIISLIYVFLGVIIHSRSLGINGNYLELRFFNKKQEQIDLIKIKSAYIINKTKQKTLVLTENNSDKNYKIEILGYDISTISQLLKTITTINSKIILDDPVSQEYYANISEYEKAYLKVNVFLKILILIVNILAILILFK